MSEFILKLSSERNFRAMAKASDEQITEAEQKLGLKFSVEYHEYLAAFGIASFYGHEFTGICSSSRLNVVSVTLSERKLNPSVPTNWYVVEQANIDSIVVWQSETGEVWQTVPNEPPEKLCRSLCEYIQL